MTKNEKPTITLFLVSILRGEDDSKFPKLNGFTRTTTKQKMGEDHVVVKEITSGKFIEEDEKFITDEAIYNIVSWRE